MTEIINVIEYLLNFGSMNFFSKDKLEREKCMCYALVSKVERTAKIHTQSINYAFLLASRGFNLGVGMKP